MKFILTLLLVWIASAVIPVNAQNLSAADVFNYKVGDSFHFIDTTTYLTDFPSAFKEVVKNKYFTDDSLYYEIEVITDDTVVQRLLVMALADTGNPVFDTTGLKVLNIAESKHFNRRSVEYVYGIMDDNNDVILFTDRFTEGLGVTYHSEQGPGSRYAYRLVYFKSGNDSMGTPVATKMELYQGNPDIIIDPNPFSTSTSVTFRNAPEGVKLIELKMLNADGLEVMRADIFPDIPHTINAHESLEPGYYFLVFQADDFRFVEKVLYKP